MDLRPYPHPGKFEGGLIVDVYVYNASLDGCSETTGNEDESCTLVLAPLYNGPDSELDLTDEEVKFLNEQAGAFVHESPEGFVTVGYMEDVDKLMRQWERIESQYDSGEDFDS